MYELSMHDAYVKHPSLMPTLALLTYFRSTYELSMILSLSLPLSPHTWNENEVKFSPNLKLVCLDDSYPQISIKTFIYGEGNQISRI